ncbi:DUF4055 domain-containing protein [Sphingomonas oryzagri]
MAITDLHPNLAKFQPRWKKIRDVIDGSYAVKLCPEAYLPRARPGQSDAEYDIYEANTSFFPGASRMAECRKGLMFIGNNVLTCSDKFKLIADAITKDAMSVREFYDEAVWDTLQTNYTGLFADHPQTPDETPADEAIDLGYRPFLFMYPAESILMPKWGMVKNKRALIYITIKESDTRILELELVNGIYVQRVWEMLEGIWRKTVERTPSKRGKPLTEIPFIIMSDTTKPYPQTGQLEDIVQLNLDHYKAQGKLAMLEMFGSGVIPVISGATPATNEDGEADVPSMFVGTGGFLVLPGENAKAYFLEPEGNMAASLRATVDLREQQMNKAGARLLTADKAAPEAPEVVLTEKAGEDAITENLTLAYNRRLDAILTIAADWLEEGATASFSLNTDYSSTTLTAQDLTALAGLVAQGQMSQRQLYWNLQKGKRVDPASTFEEERAQIEQDNLDRPSTEAL